MKTTVTQVWNGDKVKIQGKKVTGKTAWELGLIVEGQAKLLCPIDMGYLAASITVASVSQKTQMSAVKVNTNKYEKIKKKDQHSIFWNNLPDRFNPIDPPTDPNEVLVGTVVEYAPYVEFGTFKSDAQPFLRPALDMAKGKVMTLLKENGKFYFADYLRRPEEKI